MVMQFTEDNFEEEVLKSDKPVLVDFYADWCGPCKMTAPVVQALSEELAGKLKVGKVNVDENPNLAAQFKVMSIPMLFVFKNGQPASKVIGAQDKASLLEFVNQVL